MRERLLALQALLMDSLDELHEQAKRAGIDVTQLQYPSGEYAVVPVLVALTNIEVALLQIGGE